MDTLVSGGILLSGISRLVYRDQMFEERERIYPELPEWTVYLVPVFEILVGFLVWTKYRNIALAIWAAGVALFMLSVLLRRSERRKVLYSFRDSFTIQSTSVSLAFHVLWIAIIVYVIHKR